MIENVSHLPWVEKYRPKVLADLIQDPILIKLFKNSIKTGNITHFLFYGPSGTGKTSAILAIGREIFGEYYSSRVIEFNASDDRGINAVREKITNEARKYVNEIICPGKRRIPPYKIIILDEADSMTDEAQDALRVIIEQYSTVTRFCFICNYISRITDAIKSRCSAVHFKRLGYDCMFDKLKEVANNESMNLTDDIFKTIIDVSNGDMRKAIMMLQNLKYKYFFKLHMHRPICEMNTKELRTIIINTDKTRTPKHITQLDVYEIAAIITIERAHEIIDQTLECEDLIEVSDLTKSIVSIGYPIDNILLQLNRAIVQSNRLTLLQKAQIIKYSGYILYKIKECADEYIQLLDYLACIYNIHKKIEI